jgi:hypothetical protein
MKSEHRVSRRSKNTGGTVCWKKKSREPAVCIIATWVLLYDDESSTHLVKIHESSENFED